MRSLKKSSLDDLAADDVVRACGNNYVDYWRHAGRAPYADFSEKNGITWCVTGLPQDIFNVVLKCDLSPEDADRRIDEALGHLRSLRIPVVWHTGLLTRPVDIGRYLTARGFPHDYDLTAMAVDLGSVNEDFHVSDDLVVRQVSGNEDSEMWIDCLISSWGSPREVSAWMQRNPFFNAGLVKDNQMRHPRRMYLALLGGRPVGASMLFWSNGIAGLQAVGTVETQRYKGIGTASVLAPLREARNQGFRFVVVLSTVEGVRLYQRLGFRVFGKYPEHSMNFSQR